MVTVDAALEFIGRQAKTNRPFLAVVWFGSPHKPHIAIDLEKEQYKGQKAAFQNYYGEVSGMDRAFGKLRAEIARLGIRDNTLLWYCSDNGGLPKVSVTGGRGHKGVIYEGGLRVPALLEWPARIPKPCIIEAPCGTIDIYPTLLAIAGVQPRNQPPLDGISLLPLLEGKTSSRPQPMGFWRYPAKGQEANSAVWMEELLNLQKEGKEIEDPSRLLPDAGLIKKQYAEDSFPGHAAWLEWPWKLHRIQSPEGQIKYELYNLQEDRNEAKDCQQSQAERVKTMAGSLENWQASVVQSLNGKDYR
jgi:arylsulfatase A-like enzyme